MAGYLVIIPGLQNSGDTLKTTLGKPFIINKLSVNVKPALSRSGKVVFEPNPDQKPYIVFDDLQRSSCWFRGKSQFDEKNLRNPAKSSLVRS